MSLNHLDQLRLSEMEELLLQQPESDMANRRLRSEIQMDRVHQTNA